MSCWLPLVVLGLLACPLGLAQDIDANPVRQNRTPSTIADQITEPPEHDAFLALFQPSPPGQMLQRAKFFLQAFPQSAFLAQAYEVAARASFDLQDYQSGLNYGEKSLALLPENSVLLVPMADIEARERRNDAAMVHAHDALDDLDRFGPPGSIPPQNWPDLKRKLEAAAHFALGRAL